LEQGGGILKHLKGPKCIYLGKQLEYTLLDSSVKQNNDNDDVFPATIGWLSCFIAKKDEENYGNLIVTMCTNVNH
jgi:hypothetical protein